MLWRASAKGSASGTCGPHVVQRLQQEGQADLHGMIKATWIESSEGCDLVQAIVQGIAMNGKRLRYLRGGAIQVEKRLHGRDQFRLFLERTQQVVRQTELRHLV